MALTGTEETRRVIVEYPNQFTGNWGNWPTTPNNH